MDADKTKIAVGLFDKYALHYQERYMDVSKYHSSLDKFCHNLPPTQTGILELACGPGNITKYLLSKNPDLNILATDLSPMMIKLASENNPEARFQILDCRYFKALDQKFDAILCGFGLPYLSKEDAIKLIEDATDCLHKGGLLYLSTMEDSYSQSRWQGSSKDPDDKLFMYFHEAEYLIQALRTNDFDIIEENRVSYQDPGLDEVTDLVLIGKKIH